MKFSAIRQFKSLSDGLDLGSILINYINTFVKSSSIEGMTSLGRLELLSKVIDFEIGSYVLYCIIDDESASIKDIQDGMFRSGLLQSDDGDEKCEPWQLVIVAAAFEINKQMAELREDKKKAVTSD